MKPFRFRLEKVRSLRERREELAREELAGALHDQRRGEALLGEASSRVAEALDAGRRAATGTAPSGHDLALTQAWLERTERARTAAELDLGRRGAEVEARRAALVSAAQERASLERLKDRARERHVRELDRRETARLDELGLAMHRRRFAER